MSNIKIAKQYIKDLSIKVPNSPEIFTKAFDKPDIEISINIDAKKISDLAYEVILQLKASANKGELFEAFVNYGAICSIDDQENKDTIEEILLVDCPNLLFPFARNIISDATSGAGFSPLLLDPVDFSELYKKRKEASVVN